jgi:hypothetical protein
MSLPIRNDGCARDGFMSTPGAPPPTKRPRGRGGALTSPPVENPFLPLKRSVIQPSGR